MEAWEKKSEPAESRPSLNLNLDPELLRRVKVRAALEGVTVNELISRAVKVYLAESTHAP